MKSRPAGYEYACENLYPDCSTTITGRTEDEVQRRAQRHVNDHHGALQGRDDTVRDTLAWIRPVA